MKNFKAILLIAIIGIIAINTVAAQSGSEKYKFGYSTYVELEASDTVTIAPVEAMTVYEVATDTNAMVFNGSAAYAGYRFTLLITAGDTTTLKFNTKLNGSNITINEGLTKALDFVSDGTEWYIVVDQ